MKPTQNVKSPAMAPAPVVPIKEESLWKWFHPVNWLAGFITFAASFATFVYTLQPSVGLEDSGELITGAYRIGVPHPPGYPVWAMLGKLFTFIPLGDVAYRVNLMSAMAGALAAGILTLVLAKTGDIFFGEQERELGDHHLLPVFERFGLTTPRLVNSLCAIAAGVLFALTPGTWSQSTIAEAYAPNAFFMAMVVLLSLILMFNPHRRNLLCWIAFFFALGIVTHMTIIVMVPSLIWLAFSTQKSPKDLSLRGSDFYTFAVIFMLVAMIVSIVASTHNSPNAAGSGAKIALIFLALIGGIVFAWINRKPYEHFILMVMNGFVLLGFTLFMFYSSDVGSFFGIQIAELRSLPFHWNGGSNFFVWFVFPFVAYLGVAWIVNKIVFNDTEWWKVAGSFFGGLALYFYLPIASSLNPQMNWARARSVEGFWHSILRGQYEKPSFDRDPRYLVQQVWLYLKDTWDQYPMVLLFAFLSLVALALVWQRARMRNWIIYSIVTFVFCGIFMVFLMNPKLDITSQYINRVFFIMGHAGLGLLVGYGMLVVAAALFPMARKNNEWRLVASIVGGAVAVFGVLVIVAALLGQYHLLGMSIRASLCFPFFMFFGGVFCAVGLLVLLGTNTPDKSHVASLGIACLLVLTPLIPAVENWDEMNLRQKYFGFIFGIEMLKVCEPDTVFFGGTDPGRFVPEYLIGCNQFRGDIWLITQNGLADATYMNVLRDRYCRIQEIPRVARTLLRWLDAEHEDPLRRDPKSTDPKRGTIYIPSQADFENAFQVYIEEVRKRKERGEYIEEDVQIVGGKISVGGVSGVMRLNGILAERIFKENTNRHAFYVEESYVIPWMYPYLRPAGLIMKLCKDKVQMTPELVKADFAYWSNLTNMFDNGGMIEYDDVVALYWQELKAELKQSPNAPRETAVARAWTRAANSSVSVRGMGIETLPSREYLNMLYDQCKDGREVKFTQTRGKIVIGAGEFKDDEPAQKSFSKARSASAGVYEFHSMWPEAEAAYRQALWLYPQSAEAYMRLASMYMKIGKFEEALTLALEYKEKDPLNDRVDGMIGAIRGARDSNKDFVALQARVASGSNAPWSDYVKYAQALEGRGQGPMALSVYDSLMAPGTTFTNRELFEQMAGMFAQRQDATRLVRAVERMTEIDPKDWDSWLQLSKVRFGTGDISNAFQCIDKAIDLDREKARRRLAQDPQFQLIKSSPDPAVRQQFENYLK